jgi:hypothetical protein
MDIDTPATHDPHAGHNHLTLPGFSASFPLPFRVLFLIGLAQLLWATNLHILHFLGLDTAWILDFREDESDAPLELDTLPPEPSTPVPLSHRRVSAKPKNIGGGSMYAPVYKLFLIYTCWVGGGWLVFRLVTGGEQESMERLRWFVGIVMLGATLGIVAPWRGVGERERSALRKCVECSGPIQIATDNGRAVKRIVYPSPTAPVFFCDVILADILTSFAKVLGDLWISSCQIWLGGITAGRVAQSGWSNWITLTMVW